MGLFAPHYLAVKGNHSVVALCEHYCVAETVSLFGKGEAVHFVGDDVHIYSPFLLCVSLLLISVGLIPTDATALARAYALALNHSSIALLSLFSLNLMPPPFFWLSLVTVAKAFTKAMYIVRSIM